MAGDTFTVEPESLGDFQMFRLEVFEGDVSVSYVLCDTEQQAIDEGLSWGAVQVNPDGSEIIEDYQAACGSWTCRAPECRPR